MAVAAHKQMMLRSIGSYLVYPAPHPLLFFSLSLSFFLFFFILCAFAVSIFPPFPFFLFLYHLFFTSIFHVFPPSYPDGRSMCPPADIAKLQTLVMALFRALSPLAIVTLTGSMPFGRLMVSHPLFFKFISYTLLLLPDWSASQVAVQPITKPPIFRVTAWNGNDLKGNERVVRITEVQCRNKM